MKDTKLKLGLTAGLILFLGAIIWGIVDLFMNLDDFIEAIKGLLMIGGVILVILIILLAKNKIDITAK